MALLKLPDNGQAIQIDDHIASSDELLKQALAIVMPGASNIDITRKEENGLLTVTVIKKAGSKGVDYLESLKAAPDEPNPAVALAHELQARESAGEIISWEELLLMGSQIDTAINAGKHEGALVIGLFERVKRLPTVASSVVPEGF